MIMTASTETILHNIAIEDGHVEHIADRATDDCTARLCIRSQVLKILDDTPFARLFELELVGCRVQFSPTDHLFQRRVRAGFNLHNVSCLFFAAKVLSNFLTAKMPLVSDSNASLQCSAIRTP